MIPLAKLRTIDKEVTTYLTDEELENVRRTIYDFGQLMFDNWYEQKFSSKNPVRSLTLSTEEDTLITHGKHTN